MKNLFKVSVTALAIAVGTLGAAVAQDATATDAGSPEVNWDNFPKSAPKSETESSQKAAQKKAADSEKETPTWVKELNERGVSNAGGDGN